VQHIVYSSVDRGLENGGNCPSPVQHWQPSTRLKRTCALRLLLPSKRPRTRS
jgi:hypothetical protein